MRRKVVSAIVLTGALAFGMFGNRIPASADGNGSDTNYILTIPATLTVGNAGWNATDGITANNSTNDFDAGKKIIVTAVSANEWALKADGITDTVGYNLATATGTYSSTAEVPSWEFSAAELNETSGTTKGMGIIVEDYSNKAAGNYQDTVTFTAEVVDVGIPVTSVAITNAPTEALFVNSTGTLTATVLPDNATDKTVIWSSSDPDYVSINETTGEYTVKGTKGYGSATITATAGDKTGTCTITGKVHHTSLQAGDVIRVGETIYTGDKWVVNISPNTTFTTANGVITLVEDKTGSTTYYKMKRGSNGTMPNWTSFKVTDATDGLHIVSGTGTQSDKFVFAVHNKE